MALLITLLIYILVFSLIYYVAVAIMGFLETPPKMANIGKAILMVIFLIFILLLVFGGETYLPRLHWDK